MSLLEMKIEDLDNNIRAKERIVKIHIFKN